MRADSRNKFLRLGFNTDLIKKIASKHLTASALPGMSKKALVEYGFSDKETELIINKVNRQPIPKETIESILKKTGEVCCFCCDGNNTRPYQIHHIEEYYLTQDHDEDNLLLVCPTHHTEIHLTQKPREEQRIARRKWQNIWKIAFAYKKKGIAFPFQTFESVDFIAPGFIREIFSFTQPKPSVCLQLLEEEIFNDAHKILEKENRILISGSPGSGKSTLAIGIAGRLKNFLVFSCLAGNDPNVFVEEVYRFLSMAVKPVIVLIDDANTVLRSHHIEKILKACSSRKKIIVVNTSNYEGAEKLAVHFSHALFPVGWELLQSSVKRTLLKHADEVLRHLRENGLNYFHGYPIGHGIHEYQLKSVIDEYSPRAGSVWGLIYLLGSGIELIDKTCLELFQNDRLDVVVAFIAMNQIAFVEKGTSIEEIRDLYKTHSALNSKPEPELDWLKEQLKRLEERRVIKNERGRYNTVHRYYAINLIDHLYFRNKKTTEELLNRIFGRVENVKEILILWSWLMDTQTRNYVMEWHQKFDMDGWQRLIDAALRREIWSAGRLAYQMFMISGQYLPIKEGFKGKGKEIATLLNESKENALQPLYYLLTSLRNNEKDALVDVFKNLDKKVFVGWVKDSSPESFENISWICHAILEIDAVWLDKAMSLFTDKDFLFIIQKVNKGDIDSLLKVIDFQRSYVKNIKRSEFKNFIKNYSQLLKDCGLEELQYSARHADPLHELPLFENDIKQIYSALNVKRLSKDFERASPRHWGKLLTISNLSHHTKMKTIMKIIDGINVPALIDNVDKYYKIYTYELRLLIYQLCFGSEEKRKAFAVGLKPFIRELLSATKEDDVNDVFKALCRLDYYEGQMLGNEIGKTIPEPMNVDYTRLKEIKTKTKKLEAAGEDYDLSATRFSVEPKDSGEDDPNNHGNHLE